MPEYLAPGVYVEEASFRARRIEGVPTSTAAFVGPTSAGLAGAGAQLVTSLAEYERLHEPAGTAGMLRFDDVGPVPNFLWHAARAFFEEGGQRLFVARAFKPKAADDTRSDHAGLRPDPAAYEAALAQLEGVGEIGLVAAPGATWRYAERRVAADRIVDLVVAHATAMRHRMALLDGGDGQGVVDVLALRERLDSRSAALFHPWLTVNDPFTQARVDLPPSGFAAGLYARVDQERGVFAAPADEVVRLAVGLATKLTNAQQDQLNQRNINCFRVGPGQGIHLRGARTLSSDPEWKYVSVRRYLAYLERSIDSGCRWAVFEPNDERLWAAVRQVIEDFLHGEWRSGGLLGDRPERAFFVHCDRTTMTQNDVDAGRLVCLIGVAPLEPAEFVVVRIGLWTADHTH